MYPELFEKYNESFAHFYFKEVVCVSSLPLETFHSLPTVQLFLEMLVRMFLQLVINEMIVALLLHYFVYVFTWMNRLFDNVSFNIHPEMKRRLAGVVKIVVPLGRY